MAPRRLLALGSDRQIDRLGWRSVFPWALLAWKRQIVMGIKPGVAHVPFCVGSCRPRLRVRLQTREMALLWPSLFVQSGY